MLNEITVRVHSREHILQFVNMYVAVVKALVPKKYIDIRTGVDGVSMQGAVDVTITFKECTGWFRRWWYLLKIRTSCNWRELEFMWWY